MWAMPDVSAFGHILAIDKVSQLVICVISTSTTPHISPMPKVVYKVTKRGDKISFVLILLPYPLSHLQFLQFFGIV